jgi:hypothetical protein
MSAALRWACDLVFGPMPVPFAASSQHVAFLAELERQLELLEALASWDRRYAAAHPP